jgi:SDR family mycofactocin-dependent oxidoreductase
VSGDAPVAIVTGAARGIGAATAALLADAGWRLVLVDRCRDDPALPYPLATPAELDAVVTGCGREEDAIGLMADVRDQTGLDAAVATAVNSFGGLDAAVAVAGCIAGGEEAWTTSEEVWATMVGVNLEGVWRLARAAVPALLERPAPRNGRFVAVTSAGGTLGLPLLSAYAASKHGVEGLVRSMAAELGPRGITVNAVAPGSTETTMLDATAVVYGLDDVGEFARHQLGRLVRPEEVAAVVAWLCGRGTGGMTGAVVAVDGGMTAT